jgi:DNA-nicking Smr family endonuclease
MAGEKDDTDLWLQTIKKVKPLDSRVIQPQPLVAEQPHEPQPSTFVPKPINATPKAELKVAAREGIDKNQRRRMDRGDIPIEDRIDLHGLTRDEASTVLEHFIEKAYSEGKRMLLVITGKGYKSKYNKSVLKQELPHWLNRANLHGKILRFSTAQPKHGGDGAYYILLKRKRNNDSDN